MAAAVIDPEFLARYGLALAPLVIPIVSIRPRTLRDLPDWAVDWYLNNDLLRIDTVTLDKYFTYSEAARKSGRWYCAVTYMFHHQDRDHLLGNLTSLLYFGRAPFQEFGSWGMYGIFFSGGVLSALNMKKKHLQLSAWLGTLVANPFPRSWQASGWFDSGAKAVSGFLTPYISHFVSYKGASAGVFALMGCSVCVQIQYMIELLLLGQVGSAEAFSQLIMVGVDTSMILAKCYEENRLLQSGQFVGVDHAGHVDGFAVGVACYVLFKVVRVGLAWKRSRDKRWSAAARGRRR